MYRKKYDYLDDDYTSIYKSEKIEIQDTEQLENEILSFFNYFLDLCSECYDDKLPERLKMEMIRRITLK